MPKVSETEKKLNALCDNAVQLAGQCVYLQHQGEDLTHDVLGRHLINQTPKQLGGGLLTLFCNGPHH